MQRLSGLDGMFLSVDAADTTHGAMAGLLVFAPSDDPDAGSREQMIARITERLDAIPPLRWRHISAKTGVNQQYWVENPDLDVAAQVREATVGGNGSDRDLADLAAKIQETRLDISVAAWEYVIIHGLSGGRLAHLIRVHHGAIDGATLPRVLDLLSDNPVTPADPRDAAKGPGRLLANPAGAALRGTASRLKTPVDLAKIQVRTVKHLIDRRGEDGTIGALPAFVARMLPATVAPVVTKPLNAVRRRRGREEVHGLTKKLPKGVKTPFNGRITERRTYAFADLPLADFKSAGKAFDATLNDAVVSVCAGAVRRFLADHGEVPDQPLIVCVPAGLPIDEGGKDRWANHVSMFFAEFPTHLQDAGERIEAVSADLKKAKRHFDAGPNHMVRDVMRFLPQTFWDVSVKLMAKGPDWLPGAPWNVVISNVRGPATTVSICGLPMTGYWPVAFLTPGIGLNITLQSYGDRIDFGFIGCPDLTPDLWPLTGYMADSLAELKAAAVARTAGSD